MNADDTRHFYRAGFTKYGDGFGAIYAVLLGLSVSIFLMIFPGALFDSIGAFALILFEFVGGELTLALFGLVIGVVFGGIDGLIIGAHTARMTAQGLSALQVARTVRWLGPTATAASVMLILFIVGAMTGNAAFIFAVPYLYIFWIVATVASWRASIVITKKFAREYA